MILLTFVKEVGFSNVDAYQSHQLKLGEALPEMIKAFKMYYWRVDFFIAVSLYRRLPFIHLFVINVSRLLMIILDHVYLHHLVVWRLG